MVHLREGLQGELVSWTAQLDDAGNHQIRTPLGPLAFRVSSEGAPEKIVQRRGGTVIETQLISGSAFGGAGFPLPLEKRRAAKAAAQAEEPGTSPPAGAEEDSGNPPPADGGGA